MDQLIQKGAWVNPPFMENYEANPLYQAWDQDNLQAIELLLAKGVALIIFVKAVLTTCSRKILLAQYSSLLESSFPRNLKVSLIHMLFLKWCSFIPNQKRIDTISSWGGLK